MHTPSYTNQTVPFILRHSLWCILKVIPPITCLQQGVFMIYLLSYWQKHLLSYCGQVYEYSLCLTVLCSSVRSGSLVGKPGTNWRHPQYNDQVFILVKVRVKQPGTQSGRALAESPSEWALMVVCKSQWPSWAETVRYRGWTWHIQDSLARYFWGEEVPMDLLKSGIKHVWVLSLRRVSIGTDWTNKQRRPCGNNLHLFLS